LPGFCWPALVEGPEYIFGQIFEVIDVPECFLGDSKRCTKKKIAIAGPKDLRDVLLPITQSAMEFAVDFSFH
jgi:hypothetical protein